MSNYVSLHNQTHYSILDSILTPKEIIKKAKDNNQSAVAITEHGSFASAWESYKEAKAANIKLIIGCEFYFIDDISQKDEKLSHIILLAKNAIGYKNILTLNKKGFDNQFSFNKKAYSVIDWKMLETYSEGTICLTACGNGIINKLLINKKTYEAEKAIEKLINIFGDNLAFEVQANNMKRNATFTTDQIDQTFFNRQLINYSKKYNVKIVPTSNSHYLNKEDHSIHDALLSIGSKQPITSGFRMKYNVPDFYLKNEEEIKSFFSRNYGEDYANEIIENTSYFANLCESPDWIDPKYSNPSGKELPIFPVKDVIDYDLFKNWQHVNSKYHYLSEDKQYLRYKVEIAFDKKIHENKVPEDQLEIYKNRIEVEFDTLETLDLSSYMLITADFLEYARNNNIPIGPGRGSAGGSYIAHLINIHQVDSIKYELVFERFHNKLKKAVSDIDNDISQYGRDKVINYVRNKYGWDNVANVSNLNTITPKVFARDICRAFEFGGEESTEIGDSIADTIPNEIYSIDEALNKCPLFNEYAKRYPALKDNKLIDGKIRAFSTHAAGVIIGARPLTGLVPLRRDKEGTLALEYDKDVAEENGLVKIDFLGLSTLDIIEKTYDIIKSQGKIVPPIDFEAYDKKTYDLISSGDCYGVFQFGTSAGTIDLCKKIKPKSIEDLALITTLARPASKEIREDFIKTRNGKRSVSFLHPSLEQALKTTLGFPLYDESLLIIAKDVAGWDLGEADKLRKLTKEKGKNPKKAQQWKQEFIDGAIKNNIHVDDAENIWVKIVEPFGKYSFNKSHAVLYSIVSYYTAFLKAHFPTEFLLANLMSEVNSNSPTAKDNISKIKLELKRNKVKILPPDINVSKLHYHLVNNNTLLTGLDALKSVGDEAIKDIIEKRPFNDFTDFMVRCETSKVRSNVIQALTSAGALDRFKLKRKSMYLYCSDFRDKLRVWLKKHDATKETFEYNFPKESEWSKPELYALENEFLGDPFICGKLEAYGDFFKKPSVLIKTLETAKNKTRFSDLIVQVKEVFEFNIKKQDSKFFGKTMMKLLVEDIDNNTIDLTIFPDRVEDLNSLGKSLFKKSYDFKSGYCLHIAGSINDYEDKRSLIVDKIFNISQLPSKPSDLKPKKISLRENNSYKSNKGNLTEEIEDLLFNNGLIEVEE